MHLTISELDSRMISETDTTIKRVLRRKKAIDVFEGDLQFFCELLDESGYSVKHDDKYQLLWEDLRTSLNVIADERKCSGLILYALVD